MGSGHALLSPSGAERWLSCPPSARLEQGFPDRAGRAAEEGTLAHSLGETLIRQKAGILNKLQATAALRKIKADKLYEPAMLEFMEDYAGFVIERYSEAQAKSAAARLFIEHKLTLTEYIPEGFGTGDVGIVSNGILEAIDLKYGKGVPVSAENNKQMMLYALGFLFDLDMIFDLHTVRMTIYQPRLDNISTWEITVIDLLKWAEDELKPRAAMAFKGEGDFLPGKHCRFCKAKGTCRANAEFNLELTAMDFKEGPLLTDEEISKVLERSDLFTKWIKGVTDYALEQSVLHGKKWPDMKLVEGRSNRAYSDAAAVEASLKLREVGGELMYTPRQLLGITALEKAIGSAVFNEAVTPYLVKPPGKPVLVPVSDKRPELNGAESAAIDFADVDI